MKIQGQVLQSQSSGGDKLPQVTESTYPARWWHFEEDKLVCDLCPRDCRLKEGQRGACFVRQRQNDSMVLTTYGRSSGFCIDPIEKKPLSHFHPGSSVLSFGTAGCNLTCKFCQNWDISRSRDMDRLMDKATPEMVANAAVEHQARSLAYTYNDPVIFAEYAIDTAHACRERGIFNVAVTAAYIHDAARHEFFSVMDAANVDLKSFDDGFYHRLCSAKLKPVLDSLAYIYHETNCWLEITTLLIPGQNDSDQEISELARWIERELSPDVPLHFTAFHPDWKMKDIPNTSAQILLRAREIATHAGINYVYIGNIHTESGSITSCPKCHQKLIERRGYELLYYNLAHRNDEGLCPQCSHKIAGHFGRFDKPFGSKRIPIRLQTA